MIKSKLTNGEIGEFYWGYINRIPDDAELIQTLEENTKEFSEFLKTIPQDRWSYRYEPGKWSILEMVQHIIDTERIFQYRALCFARNENGPLPGFDHDIYVLNSDAENREPEDLIAEFKCVRESCLYLYKSLSEDKLKVNGNMNDMNATPRAIGYIMAGHALHHKEVITNKYL
ncbi:DinB family protein [Christiangramia sp. SM2212]|uniref:DinB family protein n=1 Tax=Christiangramia sediminicola TaxID=3073267 RepID=A0ABU1EQ51_9FLAO|nr:DinB family protein [Christiangramia sp. SM2212]MDR5590147.1 DinB family protein [Christiangramia sp. SM2212]